MKINFVAQVITILGYKCAFCFANVFVRTYFCIMVMYSVLSIRQPAHHHIGWKVAVLDSLPSHIFKSTYQGVNWGRPFFSWQYCTCYFTCTFQILKKHQLQTGRSAVLCGNFVFFWAKPENASEPEEDSSYSMYCLDLGQWKRNCVPITWSYQITNKLSDLVK